MLSVPIKLEVNVIPLLRLEDIRCSRRIAPPILN